MKVKFIFWSLGLCFVLAAIGFFIEGEILNGLFSFGIANLNIGFAEIDKEIRRLRMEE